MVKLWKKCLQCPRFKQRFRGQSSSLSSPDVGAKDWGGWFTSTEGYHWNLTMPTPPPLAHRCNSPWSSLKTALQKTCKIGRQKDSNLRAQRFWYDIFVCELLGILQLMITFHEVREYKYWKVRGRRGDPSPITTIARKTYNFLPDRQCSVLWPNIMEEIRRTMCLYM